MAYSPIDKAYDAYEKMLVALKHVHKHFYDENGKLVDSVLYGYSLSPDCLDDEETFAEYIDKVIKIAEGVKP